MIDTSWQWESQRVPGLAERPWVWPGPSCLCSSSTTVPPSPIAGFLQAGFPPFSPSFPWVPHLRHSGGGGEGFCLGVTPLEMLRLPGSGGHLRAHAMGGSASTLLRGHPEFSLVLGHPLVLCSCL